MQTKLLREIKTKEELAKTLQIELSVLEKVAKEKYKHYRKRKEVKNGKEREYSVADKELKPIHKSIDTNILDKIDYPLEINGGIKGRSRAHNSLPHNRQTNVAKFDIKDFYPNTDPKKVYISFRSIGIWKEPAALLTKLTTTTYLPIGFASSPKISALVLTKLNRRLVKFLVSFGVKHSLWIDDLTLSGNYPIKKIHSEVKSIVKSEGYTLNEKKSNKSNIVYNNRPQKVTGVVINSDISIEKEKVKQIEKAIYVCKKFGVEKYIQANEPGLSIDTFRAKMAGRIGNMLSVNRKKYIHYYQDWKKISKKIK